MNNLSYDTQQVFQEHLLKDERFLWSGQPDPNALFTTADIFLIPFSLLWGGFVIFWETQVLTQRSASGQVDAFFILWGIPFVLMGLYLIFGRFIFKQWNNRRTFYAVTNRRILCLRGRQLQEADVKKVSSINKKVGTKGVGSLIFGNRQSFSIFSSNQTYYANTGLDFFSGLPLAFFDIRDAEKVYRLITDLRA